MYVALCTMAGRKTVREHLQSGMQDVTTEKTGLQFAFRRSNKPDLQPLNWLDEAFTENMARLLSGFQYSATILPHVYEDEQLAYHELVGAGVPNRLIFNAYTEEYRVGEKGVRLPALHTLILKVREVKGPKWLREQEERFGKTNTDH